MALHLRTLKVLQMEACLVQEFRGALRVLQVFLVLRDHRVSLVKLDHLDCL